MDQTTAGRKRPHSRATLAMLTLVGIALFVGFISLGTWQVQRRAWKLDLIERVNARIQAPPAAPPAPEQWPQLSANSHEYLAVRLQGHWLASKTVLTQATTALGAGFWVMTPLQMADGVQVLVNRGFVPQEQRAQWQTPAASAAVESPVTVEGLLRLSEPGGGFLRSNAPAEQRWHSRDVAAIAQAQQLDHAAPFFVDAGLPAPPTRAAAAAAAADTPAPTNAQTAGPWPRPGLTVVRFPNSHLVYALTWYGLALMVVGAAVVVARYERRLRAAQLTPTAHDQQR